MTQFLPTELLAGTTLDVNASYSDYSSVSYSGVLYFNNASNNYTVSGTSLSDGSFDFIVSASGTQNFVSGDYNYYVFAVQGSTKTVADSGSIRILPAISLGVAVDTRTANKRVLDAVDATLEGRATDDVLNYSIAGRTLAKTPVADLVALKKLYESKVFEEERISNGRSRIVKYKYTR